MGRRAKVKPEIEILIRELLTSVKKTRLLEPAVAYEYYAVSGMNGSQISLEGDKAIQGPLLPAIFPEAKELAADPERVASIGRRAPLFVDELLDNARNVDAFLDGLAVQS